MGEGSVWFVENYVLNELISTGKKPFFWRLGFDEIIKEEKTMTKERVRECLIKALEEMEKKAKAMKIQGVGVGSVLNKGESVDWIGEMKVVETPFNFKEGWNLVAIAWSKCGEAMATEADSGNPDHEKIMGECGFVGGAFEEFEGYKLAFAFSGALSEEDLEVAKHGIEVMKRELGD